MPDQGQRTEQATPHRLRKAREEGRFPVSREFVFAIQFLVFTAIASAATGRWFAALEESMRRVLRQAFELEVTATLAQHVLLEQVWPVMLPLLAVGALLLAVSLLTQLATTGFGFATKQIKLDFSKLGLARLAKLPAQNLSSLFQALLLLPVLSFAAWAVAAENWTTFLQLPMVPLRAGVATVGGATGDLLWKAVWLFVAFGTWDLWRRRRSYQKELRMTRQEVREEHKSNEGNPEVKMRLRRIRRDLLRRRMMAEVPKATAVVMNPTHFAVAIRYDMAAMAAPRVVAKGKNYLALRIKAVALAHQVPVIENPPLAQALYKSADVGQEIPPALYRAVAEILAYIFRLRNGDPGSKAGPQRG
jgi:flagellar biosynthetic protein FlhB